MLHATGGSIYLTNGNTVINGFKTGVGNSALIVNDSDATTDSNSPKLEWQG
jgi:hypothetical protein